MRFHLDGLASKLQAPANANQTSKQKHKTLTDSMDKGLAGGSHHSQEVEVSREGRLGDDVPLVVDGAATGVRSDVSSSKDAQEVAAKWKSNLEAKKMDKCPLCHGVHFYERVWTSLQPLVKAKMILNLATCPQFVKLDTSAKVAAIVAHAGCLVCTAWDHTAHRYPGGKTVKEPKCSNVSNRVACGGTHGKWFHDDKTTATMGGVVARDAVTGPSLYEVYQVDVHPAKGTALDGTRQAMVMIDPGSDTNFITHEYAQVLGLIREPCTFRLKVIDREVKMMSTARYTIEVEDRDGGHHMVVALGLENITQLPGDPDMRPIKHLLDSYPDSVFDRPQGNVDVLLGQ